MGSDVSKSRGAFVEFAQVALLWSALSVLHDEMSGNLHAILFSLLPYHNVYGVNPKAIFRLLQPPPQQ